ncbi:MAG: phenylalanine--tRNA ligase subunit alpha [Anaerolineales bacterium]|nr:phenylalanine--tRNA ligase subunit alpha [Anaerolineales bacterium]
MLEKLNQIQGAALEALDSVADEAALEAWRVTHLGRSSALMEVFSGLGGLSREQRPAVGQKANQVKNALEAALAERSGTLRAASLKRSLEGERLDVTLPGRRIPMGRLHPDSQTMRELYRIFGEMGFQIFRSHEVESDEYNYQLLNFPVGHPARDMQDTYFVEAEGRGDNPIVLRTHTSPGQIHAMRHFVAGNPENPPPVRIVLPGVCYRYEQITNRHETQFEQIEGLAVGPGITFGDLKGTLADFARRMFGQETRTRFRASYFPFTEPSAEFDVECFLCAGKGCTVCKGSGWLEIGGCGMVHPVVLQNGGYDPQRYTGFAFGLGPQRMTMLRHRIEDIRYFYQNDLRFLEQF